MASGEGGGEKLSYQGKARATAAPPPRLINGEKHISSKTSHETKCRGEKEEDNGRRDCMLPSLSL